MRRRRKDYWQAVEQAAYSIGFLASEYVALPEVWPMFAAWVGTKSDLPLVAGPEMIPGLSLLLAQKMYECQARP